MQFDRLKRREFITLLGGAPVWPLAAGAQQRAMPVIGLLSGVSLESYADRIASFRQGLKDAGFVEGQNVVIEYRAADGHAELLAALAADLVDRQVSVIVAIAGITAIKAISTIPIVFATGADPIVAGLVKSLSRPGGNVTGVTGLGMELGPKRLELLHELVPKATILALLVNPTSPIAETLTRDLQATARILGLQLHVLHASTERDFDAVFASLVELRAGALVIAADVSSLVGANSSPH
jgi:putative tryptophan/tyrosine transport system substrate-binding protein